MLKKNLKYLFLLLGSAFLFLLSLSFYIQSCYVDSGDWGTDISFNEDFLVVMLISITLVIFSTMRLLDKGNPKTSYSITGIVVTSLSGLYPLGVFFKKLFKTLAKGEVFEFAQYQNYLFIGIFSLFLLGYFIVYYIENRKSNI